MFDLMKGHLLAGCAASMFITPNALALKGGLVNSAEVCGACHGGASSDAVSVSVEGPSELPFDREAAFVVRVRGGPLAAAGFNLRVRPWGAASLIAGDGSRLDSDLNELTHFAPRFAVDGSVTFPFRLKASGEATALTLSVVGNSVDLSDTSQGDPWNRTSLSVRVGEPRAGQDGGPTADAIDDGTMPAKDGASFADAEPQAAGCNATGGSVSLAAALVALLRLRRRSRARVG